MAYEVSIDLRNTIRARVGGIKVHSTPMSNFICDGGSVHCVTNEMFRWRVVGGTAGREKDMDEASEASGIRWR